MRVLVIGGTGSIGSAVVRALVTAGHEVSALARSPEAAESLVERGAEPVAGDLAMPGLWVAPVVAEVDAVVHAACTFGDDMGQVDTALLDALLPELAATGRRPALVYTGGCWLWGPSPDREIDEATPFDPLPAFAWSIPNLERVLAAPGMRATVLHPAMVHAEDSGPLAAMAADAAAGRPVRVVGSETVAWPLVHADDLADLYRRVLEDADFTGHVIGVADAGVPVGELARRYAGAGGVEVISEEQVAAERGDWARGFARSQRMSGALARSRFGWRPRHLLSAAAPAPAA